MKLTGHTLKIPINFVVYNHPGLCLNVKISDYWDYLYMTLPLLSILVIAAPATTSFIEDKSSLTGIIVAFVCVLIVILIAVFLYRRHLKTKYAMYLEPNKDFVVRMFFLVTLILNCPFK